MSKTNVYTHVCVHVCTHVYAHVRTHADAQVASSSFVNTHAYIHLRTHMFIHRLPPSSSSELAGFYESVVDTPQDQLGQQWFDICSALPGATYLKGGHIYIGHNYTDAGRYDISQGRLRLLHAVYPCPSSARASVCSCMCAWTRACCTRLDRASGRCRSMAISDVTYSNIRQSVTQDSRFNIQGMRCHIRCPRMWHAGDVMSHRGMWCNHKVRARTVHSECAICGAAASWCTIRARYLGGFCRWSVKSRQNLP